MNQKVRKTWKRGISLREYCVKNHMEYLLDEWDKKKNKNLMPEDIGPKSHKKIWWLLSYDDKKNRKTFRFFMAGISCEPGKRYWVSISFWEDFVKRI